MKNWGNLIWGILLIIASWCVNGCISQLLWDGVVTPVFADIGYTLPDTKTVYWILLWAIAYITCLRPSKKNDEIELEMASFKLLINWILKLVYALIAVIITNICL